MLKVSTGNREFEVSPDPHDVNTGTLNGILYAIDLIQTGPATWHMLREGKSTRIELVKQNQAEKTMVIKVNGKKITVKSKTQMDLLLEKMGMGGMTSRKVNELKSPMPGLVLEILAGEGAEIKAGEPLLILEAMKMENILKAPADVTIKKIIAEKGKAVEKNQVLVTFA